MRSRQAKPGTDPTSADPTAAASHPSAEQPHAAGRFAQLIAAGILLSRIAGLIRERVFAHYFGNSLYASAFRASLRMPNVLQNLLGEGTLSASFIPVYAGLLERGETEKAGRLAGAIFSLLLAVAGALAVLGYFLAPILVRFFFPAWDGEIRDVTIACTRIIFPMTGVLVLSAWSLGVLNSHRQFFVSYFAPVMWNAAMIGTLVVLGSRVSDGEMVGGQDPLRWLVIALAWGALLGGALQFLVQVPFVLRLQRELKFGFSTKTEGVTTVLRNAGPAVLGRGVVQLSGWVDQVLASFLFLGAVAGLGYAQTIYILPYSLFGMSVAASELTEMSRTTGGAAEALRLRVNAGLRRIALLIVPSTIGFLTMGDVIVAALYETGRFGRVDTLFVYLILAAYSLGLVASTSTRLYISAFYAEKDTRTPAQVALLRVVIAAALGFALMVYLERYEMTPDGSIVFGWVEGGRPLGAAGLAAGSGLAAWVEWFYLRRYLQQRIGTIGSGFGVMLRMVVAALAGAVAGRGLVWALPTFTFAGGHIALAVLGVGTFGLVYFAVASALGVDAARAFVKRVLGKVLRR